MTPLPPLAMAPSAPWYQLENVQEVYSPGLVVFPDRARENVRRMVQTAGHPDRLRPHIKTHKLSELTRMTLEEGIRRIKCATIAEAEMAAETGIPDILIAYQMVGPNVGRLLELRKAYPQTAFSVIADDLGVVRALSKTFSGAGMVLPVLVDLDIGQHRTGIEPGPEADELYRLIAHLPGLAAGGLHAYDGHLHAQDFEERVREAEAAFAPVKAMRLRLETAGEPVPRVVASGTPTFPIHARRGDVECSPGTPVLWDHGYGESFRDLNFLIAAVVVTRVISKPGSGRLCLDLGHKAIASEMPQPRVFLPDLPEARFVGHSEEHLVVETDRSGEFPIGSVLYGFPRHICPTVNLYSEVWVAREGRVTEQWPVTARARRIRV